jgi:phospholipase C
MARCFFFSALALTLAACNANTASMPATPSLPAPARGSLPAQPALSFGKIQHVVIVVQTNRSFNNLFATFPGADGATSGKNSKGQTVALTETQLYSSENFTNSYSAYTTEYAGGKMDGWNLVYVSGHYCATCAYAYVNPKYIKPYWEMAQQYVLADHTFPTEASGGFTAHQDLIRGDSTISKTKSLIDFPSHRPWGCDAPIGTTTPLLTDNRKYIEQGPAPCLKYDTLRDTLDAKGVSWKYYTPPLLTGGLPGHDWDAFDAIYAVRYGPEWNKNISSPETNIFSDISNSQLAAVSWVIPNAQDSDHAGYKRVDRGPDWAASIVNAIGESKYWNTSAMIIVWDNWGGWYDNVPPPQLDYTGLGFRVPMIVISPYAKQGYVDHTQYEFGSIIKFVEEVFKLKSLGTTDQRARSLVGAFDFSQAPRRFQQVPTK